MENSNASTATASVIQSFLPAMDQFYALKTLYESNDFGTKYSGLSGAMASALKGLGVENFTVDVGAAVPAERATVVKEEHSKDIEAGKIIRVTTPGMELKGNIIRMAEVVVSLGVAEAGSGFGKVAAKETE
jgi:molecular chaperone GrpE (heat shock protein)